MPSETNNKVTVKMIRDAVTKDEDYPNFTSDQHNALNRLWMADCDIESSGDPFSEENYKLLLEHFGLPKTNRGGFALSLVLALKYVPGFDEESGRPGRPELWEPFHYAFLYGWVWMRRRQNPKKSVSQAVGEAKALEGHLPSTRNLKGNYYNANKFLIIKEYDEWLCHKFSDDWPQKYINGLLVVDSGLAHERFSAVFPMFRDK